MIRYYTRKDGSRTLQWFDPNAWSEHQYGAWCDVLEVSQEQYELETAKELKRKLAASEVIMKRLSGGPGYTARGGKNWMQD